MVSKQPENWIYIFISVRCSQLAKWRLDVKSLKNIKVPQSISLHEIVICPLFFFFRVILNKKIFVYLLSFSRLVSFWKTFQATMSKILLCSTQKMVFEHHPVAHPCICQLLIFHPNKVSVTRCTVFSHGKTNEWRVFLM